MKLKEIMKKMFGNGDIVDANEVAEFSKVSFDQYLSDWRSLYGNNVPTPVIMNIYNKIKLPKRATTKSAGYDFYTPFGFVLPTNESIVIPTGIRCNCKPNYFLSLVPRSGIGFKNRVMLANTVGIIDADYYDATNEGHIMIKLVNNGIKKPCKIVSVDNVMFTTMVDSTKTGKQNHHFQ